MNAEHAAGAWELGTETAKPTPEKGTKNVINIQRNKSLITDTVNYSFAGIKSERWKFGHWYI